MPQNNQGEFEMADFKRWPNPPIKTHSEKNGMQIVAIQPSKTLTSFRPQLVGQLVGKVLSSKIKATLRSSMEFFFGGVN